MNLTYVPISCISSQSRSIASLSPAVYSAGVPLRFEQKRPVDELDVDATILHGFNRVGELDQLAGGDFRISIGANSGEFHGLVRLRNGPIEDCFSCLKSFVSIGRKPGLDISPSRWFQNAA